MGPLWKLGHLAIILYGCVTDKSKAVLELVNEFRHPRL
jgi:hypothetical protein